MNHSKKLLKSILSHSPLVLGQSVDHCINPRTAAATVCLLRIENCSFTGQPSISSLLECVQSNQSPNVSILFIKRAERDGDPWSGDVAFPGGHLNLNESDYDAALRETNEEVGLDLSDPSKYLWLGRLPMQTVFRRRGGQMNIHPHVFIDIQNDLAKAQFRLQENEVSDAFWVPVDHCFSPENQKWKVFNFREKLFQGRKRPSAWTKYFINLLFFVFRVNSLHFPSIDLDTRGEDHRNDGRRRELWGMTLTMLHSLYRIDGPHSADDFRQICLDRRVHFDNKLCSLYLRAFMDVRHYLNQNYGVRISMITTFTAAAASYALTVVGISAAVLSYVF